MELRDRPLSVKVGVYWDGSAPEPAVRSLYQVLEHGLGCDGCRQRLKPGQRFAHHRAEEENLFLCADCSGFEGGDPHPSQNPRR